MTTRSPLFLLHLLGTPRIEGAAGPADLPLGKPLAALCYLALEPTGVERSDLARILWPDSPESRARASIRQALWLIRKQTHPDLVQEENGSLALDPALIRTDLDELDRAITAERLDDAIELWGHGPLHGFSIPGAKHWQSWADAVRSRWEARLGQALERRAADTAGEERAAWLRHAVAIRPFRVESWLALVHTHVDLRQAEEAEAALAQLRKVADEGDHDLVAEAEERLHLLRRAAFGDPDARMVPEFVGRSKEFSVLMEAWRSVRSGRSRLVGIVGPSGIGKSALAAEVVRHAELDGAEVVEVRSLQTETGLDFGVVASTVTELLRRPGAAGISPGSAQVLRSLVPSEGGATVAPPQAASLADAVADLLDNVSHEAPLVLYVDDVQWMDPQSTTVLLRAMRGIEDSEVLAVWTSRAIQPGHRYPSTTALQSTAQAGLAQIVQLEPLSAGEVRELVALLLTDADPDLTSELTARLHAASGGSPLHLVELLQGLRDRGHLSRDDDGNWLIAAEAMDESFKLPHSLADALGQRVQHLEADALALGGEVAAANQPLPPTRLRERTGWTAERFDQALTALFERDLVRWTRDDRVALVHDRLAEAFEPRPSASAGRARRAVALVAIPLLLAVAFAVWQGRPSEAAPFGGGTLWLSGPNEFHALEWSSTTGEWELTGTVAGRAPGFWIQGDRPHRIRMEAAWDTVVLGGYQSSAVEPPMAAMLQGGELRILYDPVGDAGGGMISPNGRVAVVQAQPPDTLVYRTRSMIIDLADGAEPRVLIEALGGTYRAKDWSLDGRLIVGSADTPWDSLIVLDPGGRRIATRAGPYPLLQDEGFCGNDRVIFGTRPHGRLSEHMLWDWATDRLEPLDLPVDMIGDPTCSPDGTAVTFLRDGPNEQRTIVIRPLDGGADRSIPIGRDIENLRWQAWPLPVPDRVRITVAPDTLALGERRDVDAVVFDTEGNTLGRPVEWSSDDPAIAAVVRDGRVIANRPGTVTLRATVDGWIADSTIVTVASGRPIDLLAFADTFAALDTLQWHLVGDPAPRLTIDDTGRPALELTGDGRYRDGIISAESYDLTTGGSLEVTSRLASFSRPDRNRLTLCLQQGDPGADLRDWQEWQFIQEACLLWPAILGVTDRDTTAVDLWINRRSLGLIPIDTLVSAGRWQRMALQLRSDGTVSLVIGDSVLATHPIPLRNDSTTRWRATISGASVGTELLLRDVTLWREERYGRLENDPGRANPGGSPRNP